jgi:nondiscriminating glutamyl-tRNA synthetase
MHLGNARTALFNWLLARRDGGRFLLRIEDTDAERSSAAHAQQIEADLRWLGLTWDGEIVRQSERAAVYDEAFATLERAGRVYPCYCTPLEINISRKSQLAAGKPPRYAGTCRQLTPEQRAAREAEGRQPTLRFRVPDDGRVEFLDLVHGEQAYQCADIGDFIIRRADGTASFFFSNIVDDALMGVTTVLRGEDHLSNTPRQLLLAMALGLKAPDYGHISLITAMDGSPLSKRAGAKSLVELRQEGYLPVALVNLLFRLGHSSDLAGLQELAALATHFNTAHLVRSPARLDPQQLAVWQKDAVHALSPQDALHWMRPHLPSALDEATATAFVAAVRANVVLPQDVADWVQVVFGEGAAPIAAAPSTAAPSAAALTPDFAAAAIQALETHGADWSQLTRAVKEATGAKGPALFKPLRWALTGRDHGPELGPILALMGAERAMARIKAGMSA